MNSALLALLALIGYLVAYSTYGKFVGKKIFNISDANRMPAHELRDDVDFSPARKSIVFGHHFTTIAGLGPIVGPAIGIIWGWLPAFLWVFLGSIFMGAVHDFSTLVVSARNRGMTMGELTGKIIGPSTRYALQFIMQLLLFIVLAVFALIVGTLFHIYPEAVIPVWLQIPIAVWLGRELRKGRNELLFGAIALLLMYASIFLGIRFPVILPGDQQTVIATWCIILFIYVFFASTTPVQVLLQPRDYINSQQLLVAMVLIMAGLAIAHPEISAPAINEKAFSPKSDVPSMFPIMFIIIACGAISGFHSLASSGTTVKQVNKESDTRLIGYGGMITESFFAVLVLMAIGGGLGMGLVVDGELLKGEAAFHHHYASWSSANGLGAKLGAFISGGANLLETIGIPIKFGASMISVFIVSFANTTLDSATRIQRLSLQEIFRDEGGKVRKPVNNRYMATAIIVSFAIVMTFLKPGGQGAMLLWPLFGSLNQLMAALALGIVTVYLHVKGKPVIYTFIPMIFVLALTLWAMVENSMQFIGDREYLLGGLSVLVIILTGWLTFSSLAALVKKDNKPL
ncbi:MAG: carbon starvation protein A [Bacteroidales bacterium]|nr:carbon starvation protein A [Bacteroidales bacterium]